MANNNSLIGILLAGVFLFAAFFIVLNFGIATLGTLDKEINTSGFSEETQSAYNLTATTTELSFDVSAYLLPLIILIFIIALLLVVVAKIR